MAGKLKVNSTATGEDGEKPSGKWWHINKDYLPLKGYYFAYSAAMGAVVPFMGVYLRQLGLHEGEAGVILGALPIFSALPQLLLSALADRLRRPRLVLGVLTMTAGSLFLAMLFVPVRSPSIYNTTSTEHLPSCPNNTNTWMQCMHVPGACCLNVTFVNASRSPDLAMAHLNWSVAPNDAAEPTFNTQDRDSIALAAHLNLSSPLVDGGNPPRGIEFGLTFWLAFILLLGTSSSRLPAQSLADSVVYDILGDRGHLWGTQRLWGSIGYASSAVASTMGADVVTAGGRMVDFQVNFYTCSALIVLSVLVIFKFRAASMSGTPVKFRALKSVVLRPKVIVLLLLLVFYGALQGTQEAFAFWLVVEEMQSSQTVLGLCILTSVVGEVLFFFLATAFIKKFGRRQCFLVALPALAVRLGCTSWLTSPWQLVPLETLHGLTFALMWASATSTAKSLAPPALSASLQALINAAYTAGGKGMGCLVSGWLAEALGMRWTFRLYSAVSMALFLLALLLGLRSLKRNKDKTVETEECSPLSVQTPDLCATPAPLPSKTGKPVPIKLDSTSTNGGKDKRFSPSVEASFEGSNPDCDMDIMELLKIQESQNPVPNTPLCDPYLLERVETADDDVEGSGSKSALAVNIIDLGKMDTIVEVSSGCSSASTSES